MTDLIDRQAAIDVAVQSIVKWDGMFRQDANCRIRDGRPGGGKICQTRMAFLTRYLFALSADAQQRCVQKRVTARTAART